jgi:hypothetical protein
MLFWTRSCSTEEVNSQCHIHIQNETRLWSFRTTIFVIRNLTGTSSKENNTISLVIIAKLRVASNYLGLASTEELLSCLREVFLIGEFVVAKVRREKYRRSES